MQVTISPTMAQGLPVCKQSRTQVQEVQEAQTQGQECVMDMGSHMYMSHSGFILRDFSKALVLPAGQSTIH